MIGGLKVKKLSAESPFFLSGIRKGDILVSIDGQQISDELDFHFFSANYSFEIEIVRNSQHRQMQIIREEGSFSGIEFFDNPINRCHNKCIFCFIDQMPRGLRSGLYIKDEDFKHSFLNGNYVTLTSATQSDLEKIVQIGLSPLYISVHATETYVRNKMLQNKRAPDVMNQLSYLKQNGIAFHTQIVLCPGYNDGEVLRKTIKDLFSLSNSLLSIAVVPVGLTNHRKLPLQPVTNQIAAAICKDLSEISERHLTKDGIRRLFIADEFFIKADLPIPPEKYYEEYPQIENGVGLVRKLLEEWRQYKKKFKSVKFKPTAGKKKILIITSLSAAPFLRKIVQEAQKCNSLYPFEFEVVAVINHYFGEMVTVAGLLTAKDVIKNIKEKLKISNYETVILPRVMFNYAGFTLDGFSQKRISQLTDVTIKVVDTIETLFALVKKAENAR